MSSLISSPRSALLTAPFRAPFRAFFGTQSRRGRRGARQEPVEAVNLVPQPVRPAEGVDQSRLGLCQLGKSRRRSSLRRFVTTVDGIAEALFFVPQGVGQAEQAYELGLSVDQLPNDLAGLGAAIRDEPKALPATGRRRGTRGSVRS